MRLFLRVGLVASLGWFVAIPARGEDSFRLATYNLENYNDGATETRPAKSTESKAKVRESIRTLAPDVIALQEVGSAVALQELRNSLKNEGLDFPYYELVGGADTNIHVAVLSRWPIVARRPHTNDNFLLSGRRYRVSRGFAELDIQVRTNYLFTLISAHLKSKRPGPQADEAELRLEEAKLLREKIDACLARDPNANLAVLGDLNDTRDSPSTKFVIGRYRHKLVDTRPAERNGETAIDGGADAEPRTVTWTHYFPREDTYSRIDYILLSPGMAREWVPNESYVLALPGWGQASDHRPVVATFRTQDR